MLITKAIFHAKHDPSTCVGLVSGGGAGHEPAHAAYVGQGMLTAAVSGNIFASPSVPQIVATIRQIAGPVGTILIVKNYTGDVFHFHLAAEKCRANFGLKVEVIVVGDDVSVGRRRGGKVGRRGLAGTILVHKILGATSSVFRKGLEDTVRMGRKVAENLVTVAASLDHVHVPGQPIQAYQHLEDDQMELGMGIHNEPGCQLLRPRPSLDALLETMFGQLLSVEDHDRGYVDFADATEIVVLVNNLGSLSVLELSAITAQVVRKLGASRVSIPIPVRKQEQS
jgi:triose/dihydroxyacetone kinase / FAD-AMP lyase (cyclizing)